MNILKINNIESPELVIYSGLSEPQLYHYHEPDPGLFIAESPMIIRRAMDAGYEPVSVLMEDRLLDRMPLSFPEDIPVYCAPLQVLTGITGYALTRGILCAMRRKPLPSAETLLRDSSRIAVLENVMNPRNTGAIFRSAAAMGMDAVLLTRGCTDPLYRRAARVSMGTVFQIPWTYLDEWPSGIELLHQYGYTAAAMTLNETSVSLRDFHPAPQQKVALILGTEGPGLSDETVSACDLSVRIPMYHGVDSLNVAAAGAVAFWHLCGDQ